MSIPKMKRLKLYKALELGYLRDPNKQRQRLKRFGYQLDPNLTTREYVTAYNPFTSKLLHISNGTDFSNSVDVQNLIPGLIGSQSLTRRREEEKNALLKAKQIYKPKQTVLVGHSLGSQYTQYIAAPQDRVIQYNPFVTAGAKARENVQNYRTKYDLVSAFAPQSNTTTLPNHSGILYAHNAVNIRREPIFV